MGAAIYQMSLKQFVKANGYTSHNGEEERMADAYNVSS